MKLSASQVKSVGRATVFLVGLAVILALVFGAASTAFAHKGDKGLFHLAQKNIAAKVSTLVQQGPGPALDLQVKSGPPLKVNSDTKVKNLNADKLDGKKSSAFFSGATYLLSETNTSAITTDASISLQCDAGDKALSGGLSDLDPPNSFVVSDRPDPNTAGGSPTGWLVSWRNTVAPDEATGYVVCADFPPARTP